MNKLGSFLKGLCASRAGINKKCVEVIVANKVRNIVIGGVAAVAIGGAVTTAAIINNRHEHTPLAAVTEACVASTCITEGSYDEVVYCEDCGEELNRKNIVISVAGHTEVIDAAIAPTCTEKGLYYTCLRLWRFLYRYVYRRA